MDESDEEEPIPEEEEVSMDHLDAVGGGKDDGVIPEVDEEESDEEKKANTTQEDAKKNEPKKSNVSLLGSLSDITPV